MRSSYQYTALITLGICQGQAIDQVRDCLQSCGSTDACNTDPQSHSSYCKFWLTRSVCFGLYWTDANATTMCFSPNDPACPQQYPVLCNETSTAFPTLNPTTFSSDSDVNSTSRTFVPTEIVRTSTESPSSTMQPTSTAIPSNISSAFSSSTMAPETSTASPITSTIPVSPTNSLSGKYCGLSEATNLIGVDVEFNPESTVSITLSNYLNGSISNVPYVYDSTSGLVSITPTPAYVGFLNSLPLFLVPQDIVVVYSEPPTDVVTITVLGVIIQATKSNCLAAR